MNNDYIDPKFKKIAIDLDDFEPEDGGGTGHEESDEPTLTLGLEAVVNTGRHLRFAKEFRLDAIDDYLFLQPDDENHYRQTLPWISILSLAGARTFTNPDDLVLFVDPQGSWIDLYFSELPAAVGNADYGQLIWGAYSSIDLWLKDNASGEILKRLRLVAPADQDAEEGP